jgi:hypothetical protein
MKSHVFLSRVKYRRNRNAGILWNTGHDKGSSHMRGGV